MRDKTKTKAKRVKQIHNHNFVPANKFDGLIYFKFNFVNNIQKLKLKFTWLI